MTTFVSPQEAKRKLDAREGEFALFDVREEGVFARGHLLFATSLPLSKLEIRAHALCPRRETPIALTDDGDGLAERAAILLGAAGYTQVAIVEGGMPAFVRTGFEIFQGVNVPSKAFGEFVEHRCGTPRISPTELSARMNAGEDLVVLDARPFDEYQMMNIPGALSCPSQELLYRLPAAASSPSTTIVVNCAGRTRSIIGAQSLLNGRVDNSVFALENGTMGWKLGGYDWEKSQTRCLPRPAPDEIASALSRVSRIAARAGVRTIDWATFEAWRAQIDRRTLYLFDIRPMPEYFRGHIAGAIPVEGVQLVQKTDNYIAVHNARIILSDDDGVRARMTAAWLAQMGYSQVAVLAIPTSGAIESGPYRPELLCPPPAVSAIVPEQAAALLKNGGATIYDVASSLAYKKGHIPGARFVIRARLSASLARIPVDKTIIVTSEDGLLATYTVGDIAKALQQPVHVLSGGTRAWAKAGYPLATGLTDMIDPPEDMFWRPYELDGEQRAEMQKYLDWEQGLIAQVERDGGARFHPLTPDDIWS